MSDKKKILFLVPYPLHLAPSQRFRVENFLHLFPAHLLEYTVQPFLDEHTYQIIYKKGNTTAKLFAVLKGFARRFAALLSLSSYNYVFVHREAAPLGPPVFEWIIAKLFRKKIIYDFDDAIWIADDGNAISKLFKATWKVRVICSLAYKVAGGNEYLCNYAKQYNSNVVLLPTSVDIQNQHNQIKDQQVQRVVIGWTGSHSTLKYLQPIISVLQKLVSTLNVEFIVICNKRPDFEVQGLTFIPWNERTEIDDLLQMNIGIMPLQEDAWSEGKCGFKIIQYLALGIPAVASPVGVNKKIIEPNRNGFLCTSEKEWEDALTFLISNANERTRMGANGRRKIVEQYSVQANEETFFSLFE